MSSGDGGGALNSEQCGENMSESHTRVHTSAAVDSFRKEGTEERVSSHVFILFYFIVLFVCLFVCCVNYLPVHVHLATPPFLDLLISNTRVQHTPEAIHTR